MFPTWGNSRIRTLRRLLAAGRIDDALAHLQAIPSAEAAQIPDVLTQLQQQLAARARLRREAGDDAQAIADLDRAETLAPLPPDMREFRERLAYEIAQASQLRAEAHDAEARARQKLRQGRLESARMAIESVPDPKQAAALAGELDARTARAAEWLGRARRAADAGDILSAVQLWRESAERFGRTGQHDELAAEFADGLKQTVARWLNEGRIERLQTTESALRALYPLAPTLVEELRIVALIDQAGRGMDARDYPALRGCLMQLAGVSPPPDWLGQCLAALEQIRDHEEWLLRSPLGALRAVGNPSSDGRREIYRPQAHPADAVAQPPPRVARAGLSLDRPIVLLVDGAGAALLVSEPLVQIGRAGISGVTLGFERELLSQHAEIRRSGEQFWLTATGPCEVNQRRAERMLLCDGDRVGFGAQVRMVFLRPSAKSESAVLRLSHRCRLPQDVGLVILMQDTCLIGPTPTCHIRTREGAAPLVLFTRGGQLHARGPDGLTQPVVEGESLDLGDIRLVARRYAPSGE